MTTELPQKRRFRAPRWLNLLILLVIAGFLVRTLVSGWDQLREEDWQLNIVRLVGASMTMLVYFAGQGLLWSWSVRQLGENLTYRSGLEIFITSQLAKYVPGGVWSFANVALNARQAGLSSTIMVFMFVVNMILVVWSASLCALPVLPTVLPDLPATTHQLLIAAILVASLTGGPLVLRRVLKLLANRQHLKLHLARLTTYPRVIFMLAASLLLHVLNCVSFFLYVSSLIDVPAGKEILVGSAWSAAWVMGFIVLFMPSGLGVREVSLVFLLGSVISPSITTAISLGHRVLLTAIDLFLLLLVAINHGIKHTGQISRFSHLSASKQNNVNKRLE